MFGLIDALIVRPIVNILFVIYSLVGDFGLAIIIFTAIVKLATWPLMKSQIRQTRIMRELQPELAKIKKNCKGNQQLESIQMMDLYKRKNYKPFRSLLTVFIQLPIFIGLFTAINVAVRPRVEDYNVQHSAYSFIEPLNNVNDLIELQNHYFEELKTNEQASYSFKPQLFGTLDLSVTAGFGSIDAAVVLIFALISAGTQLVMSKQMNPSKNGKKKKTMRQLMKEAAEGKEVDQSEINEVSQGSMTYMMPIMMLFIMINLPGALVMYYLLNNLTTIVINKILLNKNYEEMENTAEKRVLKELRDAQEAIIVKDETIAKDEAKIERLKKAQEGTLRSNNKNKKSKEHITRITASDKKKRR